MTGKGGCWRPSVSNEAPRRIENRQVVRIVCTEPHSGNCELISLASVASSILRSIVDTALRVAPSRECQSPVIVRRLFKKPARSRTETFVGGLVWFYADRNETRSAARTSLAGRVPCGRHRQEGVGYGSVTGSGWVPSTVTLLSDEVGSPSALRMVGAICVVSTESKL